MTKKAKTKLGILINRKLDEDFCQTKEWLASQVSLDTGLYCDGPYISRVLVGDSKNPKIINSICKILDIEYPTQDKAVG